MKISYERYLGITIYFILTVPLLAYCIVNDLWTNVVELIPWIGYVRYSLRLSEKISDWILSHKRRR